MPRHDSHATAPEPQDGRSEPLTLVPILDPAKLPRKRDGQTIRTTYTTGQVAKSFFDRGPDWMQQIIFQQEQALRHGTEPLLAEGLLPEPAEISGERGGNRQWTLPDVEKVAFALFQTPLKPTLDAAWLLKVLDVVYATARLQGLLPGDCDPIAELRPALS